MTTATPPPATGSASAESLPRLPASCVVCASPYVAWVRRLPIKVGGHADLFCCLACESFFSPFAPKSTITTGHTAWHLSVEARNEQWSRQLLEKLVVAGARGPIVEIGSGIGTFLRVAREFGLPGVGFDLDSAACEHGRRAHHLDLRAEWWKSANTPDFRTMICISVLEHIHEPRALLQEMIQCCLQKKAQLYVSVPFFDRNWWPHLKTDSTRPGHPFEYPHAHVVHYSHEGFQTACRAFGATRIMPVGIPRGWFGYLIS
jgi:hypothetical protein